MIPAASALLLTWTYKISGFRLTGKVSQTMTEAPASSALAMKLCPSVAAPFTATNKELAVTFLESSWISFTEVAVFPTTVLIATLYNMSCTLTNSKYLS